MILLVALAGVSFALSAALTYLLCTSGRNWLSLDVPNARSLHDQPTPRGGGLAILVTVSAVSAGLLRAGGGTPGPGLLWVAIGGVAIAAVSWVDDRRSVSPLWRLVVHLAASAVFVVGALSTSVGASGALYGALIVLVIAWSTNLYNFMDGMDGFAGGMAVIGFGTLGVLAWLNGDREFTRVFVLLAAAASGFLVFNLPPARIFLGDVGASTIGYLAATLGILAVRQGAVSWQALVLVFSPFLVDATATLLRRLLSRSRVWQAHRTHFYQRLVGAGWSTPRTLRAEYLLMTACAGTAVIVEWSQLHWTLVLGVWSCVYAALIIAVVQFERSQQRHQPTRIRATL